MAKQQAWYLIRTIFLVCVITLVWTRPHDSGNDQEWPQTEMSFQFWQYDTVNYQQLWFTSIMKLDKNWENFKKTFSKVYVTLNEEINRYMIFMKTLKSVKEHNKRYDMGLTTYYQGINQFSDMEHEEFIRAFGGRKRQASTRFDSDCFTIKPKKIPLYKHVNWAKEGYVTDVKYQGINCHDCYAFATAAAMESTYAIKNDLRPPLSFSEQQIVDCAGNKTGCYGGDLSPTYLYLIKSGIEQEKYYPYTGKIEKCKYNEKYVVTRPVHCVTVPVGNEWTLQYAIAVNGPVSVGLDGMHNSFKNYEGGIYDEPMCSTTDLNHAMLVVGYGSSKKGDYWIAKNSYGTKWGMQGYVMMSRNKGNQCGIASDAVFPFYPGDENADADML